MGFLKPQSGTCTINSLDCWNQRDQVQKLIGYVPGEITFFDEMTGTEFLKFEEEYRGIRIPGRKEELLDRFSLDPSAKIRKMSKGTKQKLAIIAAFMHDPEILILDEPTSGLDPLMQKVFVDLLNEEKKRGKTVFLSSHMFEEVDRTCDRIGMIRHGRIVTVETVETLRRHHLHTYTVTLPTETAAAHFAEDFSGEQNGLQVTVSARRSLEEIFMNCCGGNQND